MKARTKKKSHKFGISVPGNVQEAYDLDRQNQSTYWRDAIAKEMKNVMIAFDVLDDGKKLEPGREFIKCYMIFDVKMDFTRKARFVANGSRTRDPAESTYAGVVSRETVRIALTYAAWLGHHGSRYSQRIPSGTDISEVLDHFGTRVWIRAQRPTCEHCQSAVRNEVSRIRLP